jgi:GNAT superfamily N-acetyltransferase
MAAESLHIAWVAYAAAAGLIAELDADLGVRYGGGGDPVHAPAAEFDGPGGQMLLATLAGAAVGCVGLRRVSPDTAELKRMYVRPGLRRQGIARALLAACEQAASQLGYLRLWLETGTLQPEAVALYRSSGYQPVPPFGQYAHANLSVHLGRAIGPTPTAEAGAGAAAIAGRCDPPRNRSH